MILLGSSPPPHAWKRFSIWIPWLLRPIIALAESIIYHPLLSPPMNWIILCLAPPWTESKLPWFGLNEPSIEGMMMSCSLMNNETHQNNSNLICTDWQYTGNRWDVPTDNILETGGMHWLTIYWKQVGCTDWQYTGNRWDVLTDNILETGEMYQLTMYCKQVGCTD